MSSLVRLLNQDIGEYKLISIMKYDQNACRNQSHIGINL